jgi:citrate synthase
MTPCNPSATAEAEVPEIAAVEGEVLGLKLSELTASELTASELTASELTELTLSERTECGVDDDGMLLKLRPLPSRVNLDSVIDMSHFLSASSAAQRLGVSRATLYSYVSRGLIRSRAVAGQRVREYAREDVERMAAQTRGRRDPLGVAQRALALDGLPVLDSELCSIDGGRIYYRGHDAIELSRRARFEDVAALLWQGPCALPAPSPAPPASVRRMLAGLDFAAAASAHLARVQHAVGRVPLEPEPVRGEGARMLVELCTLALGFVPAAGDVAARLCVAFGVAERRARRALEAALIVCADHELNASAFAARVVASTGASPYMAVIGAFCALSGQRHGGVTEAVARLLDEPGDASDVLAARMSRGELVPGFGHPLYPGGDPRAARLLELCPKSRAQGRAERLAEAAESALGLRPNVDFALVALSRSLGLPAGAPFMLFAIGRVAGWVAHILEQYASGGLIRPRARYVGVAPRAARSERAGA